MAPLSTADNDQDGEWVKWRIFVLSEIKRLSDSVMSLTSKLEELSTRSLTDSEVRGGNIALLNQAVLDLRKFSEGEITEIKIILNNRENGIFMRLEHVENDNLSSTAIKKYKAWIIGLAIPFLLALLTPVIELIISLLFPHR